MADDAATRRAVLDRLLPLQREDFAGIFKAMDGFPVNVRLLDPPLARVRAQDRSRRRGAGIFPYRVPIARLAAAHAVLGISP